jgi:hypothetical protein
MLVPRGTAPVNRRAFVRRRMQRAKASTRRSKVMSVSRNVHSFRRMTNSYTEDVTGLGLSGALTFKLADTINYSEFDVLYDRYMITMVVLRVRIVNNPDAPAKLNSTIPAASDWNSTNWFPRLFYCKDYDDDTAETLPQLRERAKTKMVVLKPNRYHKIVVRPSVLVQGYYTTLSAGYIPKWNQWVDMGQNSLKHYGLKYNLDCSGINPVDTAPFKLEWEHTYYFKCKDVR